MNQPSHQPATHGAKAEQAMLMVNSRSESKAATVQVLKAVSGSGSLTRTVAGCVAVNFFFPSFPLSSEVPSEATAPAGSSAAGIGVWQWYTLTASSSRNPMRSNIWRKRIGKRKRKEPGG